MAIEGPLRELSLTDVIQLLHLSRKTGTLAITADGARRPGLIHFEQGSVVGARPAGEGSPLGRLLVMDDITNEREMAQTQRDFVAMIGHELRTPLTVVKGFARMMLRRVDSVSREESMEALSTQALRILRLFGNNDAVADRRTLVGQHLLDPEAGMRRVAHVTQRAVGATGGRGVPRRSPGAPDSPNRVSGRCGDPPGRG